MAQNLDSMISVLIRVLIIDGEGRSLWSLTSLRLTISSLLKI